jgi:hypothetical protein
LIALRSMVALALALAAGIFLFATLAGITASWRDALAIGLPDWPLDPRVRTLLNAIPQASTVALVILVARVTAAPQRSVVAPESALAS